MALVSLKSFVADQRGFTIARWLWLRSLGLVFLSVFASLAQEIHALIGPNGIAPAGEHLADLYRQQRSLAYFSTPTLLWIRSDDLALTCLVVAGLLASAALLTNVLPRAATLACAVLFLSFIRAAPGFSGFEPDGLLTEAAITSAFVAPQGMRPGLGVHTPPTRIAYGLLQLLWFRLYLDCGIAKLFGPDGAWTSLSALDHYYGRQPFPTWIAWWFNRLPHHVHAASVLFVLLAEVALPLLALLYYRTRVVAFLGVSALQLGIILNGNYASLNYLSIALGVVLLDDGLLSRLRLHIRSGPKCPPTSRATHAIQLAFGATVVVACVTARFPRVAHGRLAIPARIAGTFGIGTRFALFDTMPKTHPVLEFQGSIDGNTFAAFRTRYGTGSVLDSPRVYAPYQSRFDWGLWYLALAPPNAQRPLLSAIARGLTQSDPTVRRLFRVDPFAAPPRHVRVVQYEYRFTTEAERRQSGAWWSREVTATFDPVP